MEPLRHQALLLFGPCVLATQIVPSAHHQAEVPLHTRKESIGNLGTLCIDVTMLPQGFRNILAYLKSKSGELTCRLHISKQQTFHNSPHQRSGWEFTEWRPSLLGGRGHTRSLFFYNPSLAQHFNLRSKFSILL